MSDSVNLEFNLKKYKEIIERNKTAKLLAVSKTKPNADILKAYNLGQIDFGENKVQELFQKSIDLKNDCPNILWHFIGNLQSNKINQLLKVDKLVSIHSIDSIKLLNKLLGKKIDKKIGLFLQVNTSLEDEKSGFEDIIEILKGIELINRHEDFYFQGLMTIGRIRTEDFTKSAHECFSKLVEIKEQILSKGIVQDIELSMGMSNDYEIALAYKSNWIRIGSAIFGQRGL